MNIQGNMNRPVFQIGHVLTTITLAVSLLAMANATENKVERNEAVQQMMIQQQQELKADFKDYRKEQRILQNEQMKMLIEIQSEVSKGGE